MFDEVAGPAGQQPRRAGEAGLEVVSALSPSSERSRFPADVEFVQVPAQPEPAGVELNFTATPLPLAAILGRDAEIAAVTELVTLGARPVTATGSCRRLEGL